MLLLLAACDSTTLYFAQECHLYDLDSDGYAATWKVPEAKESGVDFVPCTEDEAAELIDPASADCDDQDPAINAGAQELCGNDVDEDCDRVLEQDLDGDGAYGTGTCATDCDDENADIHPGATEACNLIDDDCDLLVDEDLDMDGDGWLPCDGDCDDTIATIHPFAIESCDNLDDDCDGALSAAEIDEDGDGITVCDGDCDDTDAAVFPGASEVCDGIDNDCSGEGLDLAEQDLDGDGVIGCLDCDDTNADRSPWFVEWCDGVDNNCDEAVDESFDADADGWTSCAGDCADDNSAVYPGATELCDGADGNCDGLLGTDELDADGDGHIACVDDCDDTRPDAWTAAPEACNGEDDDCDGLVPDDELDVDGDGASSCEGDCDDTNPRLNLFDLDGDGASSCGGDCDDLDPELNLLDADGDGASSCDGDCDDLDPAFSPFAAEVCNEIDDDCDGAVDEDFADTNGDDIADCIELCDHVDNDGDGSVDEGYSDGSQAGTWVSASAGTPAGDGSYVAPLDTIAAAVARSLTDDPCPVLVSPGTYNAPFELGAAPVEIESTDGPEVTILEGGATAPILTITDATRDTVVSGFTFRGGALMDTEGTGLASLRQGGAVQVLGASPTLRCSRFEANEAADRGAAIFVDGGSPSIEDSLFYGNVAWGSDHDDGGGALYGTGSGTIEVSGSTFLANTASSDGGAIDVQDGIALVLSACRFGANTSESMGGALAINDAGFDGSGLLFQANQAVSGGAVLADIGTQAITIANATLIENVGTSGYGGGLAFQDDGVVARSLILGWPGTGGLIGWVTDDVGIDPVMSLTDSTLYDPAGGWVYSNFDLSTDLVGVDGNIGEDPGFTRFDADLDTFDDDLSLTASSPARDAGASATTDADGSPADMGGLGGPTPYEPVPSCFGSMP